VKVGRYDAGGMLPGFEFEGVLIDGMRIMIDMSDMGLAYTYYICVCYGDASARMLSLVMAGYWVQCLFTVARNSSFEDDHLPLERKKETCRVPTNLHGVEVKVS